VLSSHIILFTVVITRAEFGTARHIFPPSSETASDVVVAAISDVIGGIPEMLPALPPADISTNPLSPPIKNGTCPVILDARPIGTIVFTFFGGTPEYTGPIIPAEAVFVIVVPRCDGSSYKLPKSKMHEFGNDEYIVRVFTLLNAVFVFDKTGSQFLPLYEYSK
jgi:hypothetical protein